MHYNPSNKVLLEIVMKKYLLIILASWSVFGSAFACKGVPGDFDRFPELLNKKVQTEAGVKEIIDIEYVNKTHSNGLFSVCNHTTFTLIDEKGNESRHTVTSTVPFNLNLDLLLPTMRSQGVDLLDDIGVEADMHLYYAYLQQKNCLQKSPNCPLRVYIY